MKQLIDCRFLELKEFKLTQGFQPQNSLLFLERGKMEFTLKEKMQEAAAHQLISFPDDLYFERKVIEPISFYYVRYENPDQDPLPAGRINLENTGRLLSTLQFLLRLNNLPREQELKNALLADIFHQIQAETLLGATVLDPILARITAFFEKNLHRKINLEEVAEVACLSPNGVIRHCKKHLGFTPIEYLNRLRIERAEALLCQTGESIETISRLCGFETPYYFSNVFKKNRGCSPSAYREKHKL